jgi:hypothetical protein
MKRPPAIWWKEQFPAYSCYSQFAEAWRQLVSAGGMFLTARYGAELVSALIDPADFKNHKDA